MTYYCWWLLSACCLAAFSVVTVVLMLKRHRGNKIWTPLKTMLMGVASSAFFLFLPLHQFRIDEVAGNALLFGFIGDGLSAVLMTLQHVARLFMLEGDYYEFFLEAIKDICAKISGESYVGPDLPVIMYVVLGSVLYVLAPMLTFAAVLLFFKNIWSYLRFFTSPGNKHVFSELNSKSLALAKSIVADNQKAIAAKFENRGLVHFLKRVAVAVLTFFAWIVGGVARLFGKLSSAADQCAKKRSAKGMSLVTRAYALSTLLENAGVSVMAGRKNAQYDCVDALKSCHKGYVSSMQQNRVGQAELDVKCAPVSDQGLADVVEKIREILPKLTKKSQELCEKRKALDECRAACRKTCYAKCQMGCRMSGADKCWDDEAAACAEFDSSLELCRDPKVRKQIADRKHERILAIGAFRQAESEYEQVEQERGALERKLSSLLVQLESGLGLQAVIGLELSDCFETAKSDYDKQSGQAKAAAHLAKKALEKAETARDCACEFAAYLECLELSELDREHLTDCADRLKTLYQSVQSKPDRSSEDVAYLRLRMTKKQTVRVAHALIAHCASPDDSHLQSRLNKSVRRYKRKFNKRLVRVLDWSEIFSDCAIGLEAAAGKCDSFAAGLKKLADKFLEIVADYVSHMFGVTVIFTDVLDKNEEEHYDLVQGAKEIGAILFRKDLESISFSNRLFRLLGHKLNFYLISEDEPEKLRHATSIMQKYQYRNTTLHVFSESTSSKMLLGAKDLVYPKVIRIHDHQSLIYHNLDTNGIRLFRNAYTNYFDPETGCYVITAVVVGLGKYGKEMLKALAWYCQIPGYRIDIHGFDSSKDVIDELRAECPGLTIEEAGMQESGYPALGDFNRYVPRCRIFVHPKIDVHSKKFIDALAKIKNASYVFVCLGTDENNIAAAAEIREYYEQSPGITMPEIDAVVYDSNLCEKMGYDWNVGPDAKSGCLNYRGQEYRICMIGSVESFYSVDTMLDSRLTANGLNTHREYCSVKEEEPDKHNLRTMGGRPPRGWLRRRLLLEKRQRYYDRDNESFWRYEYNYRSSLAQAMFNNLLRMLVEEKLTAVPGYKLDQTGHSSDLEREKNKQPAAPGYIIDKTKLTAEEKLDIERIEHVRWLVYMQTEGYQYAEKRNDLGKRHNRMIHAELAYKES